MNNEDFRVVAQVLNELNYQPKDIYEYANHNAPNKDIRGLW